MQVSAYLFEARQIQRFVFATGKLRDASGASELLDALSNDAKADSAGHATGGVAGGLLDKLLPDAEVFRAAGGALDIVHPDAEKLKLFRAAFRLELARRAPGLVFSDSLATAPDVASAREAARNGMSDGGPVKGLRLPLGSPLVRPAPRSGGNPADLSGWTKGGRCKVTGEHADLATQLARQYLESGREVLADKFLSRGSAPLRWPTVLSVDDDGQAKQSKRTVVFPFAEGMIPRIAILHADGNGMGALFKRAVERYRDSPKTVRDISRALAAATQAAVQSAMKAVADQAVNGIIPARPIVLGGDDVSLILRADLAPQFALDFAEAFGALATAAMKPFGVLGSDEAMTTKVGFVVIGPNQPFAQAYSLAESLASAARSQTESRIAFCRVAGAAIPSTADDLDQGGVGDGGYTLWRAAHGCGEFGKLLDLARLLDHDDVGRGSLRRVAGLLKTDRVEANRVLERALSQLGDRNGKVRDALVHQLEDYGVASLPDRSLGLETHWFPLLQAHDLSHILGKAA